MISSPVQEWSRRRSNDLRNCARNERRLAYCAPQASNSEAENAEQVLTQVRQYPWDRLILDITMPGRSGLDIIADLKLLRPQLPVLVLSMLPEDQFGKRVLTAGALGYLKKESAPEELIEAIRKVLAGGRYVSPALAEKIVLDLDAGANRPLHERLSAREFEILVMLGCGENSEPDRRGAPFKRNYG